MKLSIELVPAKCWYSNVRSNVDKKEWDRLRKKCYKAAGYRCEICNGKGPKHPVECHEIWHYDDQNKIQTLEGLISLCPKCHRVKHYGLSQMKGMDKECIKHLCSVNKMTQTEATKMVIEAFDIWDNRSKYDWQLDISFLDSY